MRASRMPAPEACRSRALDAPQPSSRLAWALEQTREREHRGDDRGGSFAGRAVAKSEGPPSSSPSDSAAPARTATMKLTALVTRNRATVRRASRFRGPRSAAGTVRRAPVRWLLPWAQHVGALRRHADLVAEPQGRRRQSTARNTTTNARQEASSRAKAEASQPGLASGTARAPRPTLAARPCLRRAGPQRPRSPAAAVRRDEDRGARPQAGRRWSWLLGWSIAWAQPALRVDAEHRGDP